MSEPAPDVRYLEARRVLLDAFDALGPQLGAFVLAGAQAVYLRTGPDSLPVADYTTDGDLALDPTLLVDAPTLGDLMQKGGFKLAVLQGAEEPGIWVAPAMIDGVKAEIAVDLIVPDGVAPPGGTRSARIHPHGKRAARKAVGLEAALVDSDEMTIEALDRADSRSFTIRVAGIAALIVAKIHKIGDRIGTGHGDRLKDKDAADVLRLMQAMVADEVAATLIQLSTDPRAGAATRGALERFDSMFGTRNGIGVEMAIRSLRLAVPEDRVRAMCLAYAGELKRSLAIASAR